MRRFPRARRALAGLAIAALATPMVAQQAPTPDNPDSKKDNIGSGQAQIGAAAFHLDDEPDFAPMRRIADGEDDNDVTLVPDGNPYVLSFLNGDFTPDRGIDPQLAKAAALDPTGSSFGYVMVRGRLNHPAKMAKLRGLGLELFDPHTWQSVSARIPHQAIAGLRDLDFVHWVGFARTEQKVHPNLAGWLDQAAPTDEIVIHVSTFVGDEGEDTDIVRTTPPANQDPMAIEGARQWVVPNGPFQRGLEALGFRFAHYHSIDNVHVFEGTASKAAIERIRELNWVAFVEQKQHHELAHDQSMTMVSLDRVRGVYDGADKPGGVIDTGIDGTPWHTDLVNKVYWGWSNVTGGPWADGHGHGTHVTGTVAGRGAADARYRGGCPAMGSRGEGYRIYIGRYFDNAGAPQGSVANLYSQLSQDVVNGGQTNKKARVVNNSWGSQPGSSLWSGTESGARLVDPYVHRGQTYVFAAGNKGTGLHSPASAKNVLAVASVDDRGARTGKVSSFSKYDVSDNRRKPEVAAPGNVVTSCNINTSTGYTNKSGTSMAAPHVTAALCGLAEHYSFLDYQPAGQQAVAIACSELFGRRTVAPNQGWGMINAYKMHYSGRTSWWAGTNSGSISSTGRWVYWDVAIPSNIDALVPVLVWMEPAASSGATQARRSDIRLYLDNTRNSTPNFGQNSLSSSYQNKLYSTYTGSTLSRYAGQTVRVKVYGQSVSGAVNVGVCLFYHIRSSTTPNPTISVLRSTSMVKPNQTFTVTGRWNSASTGDEFDNGWMYLSSSGFTRTQLRRSTADVVHTYTGTSHPSSPYPSVTSTNGIAVGQGTARSAEWTLRSSTNGVSTLRVYGLADYRSTTSTVSAATTICVDGLGPNTPTITSSTHTVNQWTNNRNYIANWAAVSDNGCAGMQGYGYRYAAACSTASTMNLGLTTTHSTTFPSTSGARWYFNLRGYDRLGNAGSSRCAGPYLIDSVAPSSGTIQIENNASVVRGLTVRLTGLSATEPSNGSGVAQMRFSNNNSTWSSWEAYASTRTGWDLSAFGGNASVGTKRVYVQYRDNAGNTSSVVSDSTTFDPVDVGAISPNRGPLIGGDTVTITGAGFISGRTTVRFAGKTAANVNVVSSTQLTCVTPTHLTWEKVDVRVDVTPSSTTYGETRTDGYEYVGGRVNATGNPRLGIAFPVTFDAPVDGGRQYVGAASLGQGPIPLPPHGSLNLTPDGLFNLTTANVIPQVFAGIRGTMNGSGQAICQVTVPNVPVAQGLTFYMAYVTVDTTKPLSLRTVSSNRGFTIQP